MRLSLREITLYRFRYIILYVLFAILLVILLTTEMGRIPYGLTQDEMTSVTRSVTLNITQAPADAVVNAPYHVLQKASVGIFGLTPFAIKLPSVILALLMAVAVTGVIRRFFRYSATIITSLLMASSLPFLIMGRIGAPLIMLSLFSALMMVAGASVVTNARYKPAWKVVTVIAAIGLLYTPLGIYPLLAFVLAGILHPHLRYHIMHTKPKEWVAIGVSAALAIALLAVAVVREPGILLTLAGIPADAPGAAEIMGNLSYLGGALFNVIEPTFGVIATPVFGLPLLALMVFGIVQLIYDRHSARTYFLIGWLSAFVIILALNTQHILSIFIPAVMLMAIGIEAFLREWYSLFPKNPYARLAALVPLSVLIVGIITSETSRYFNGYRYAPETTSAAFNATLPALNNRLATEELSTASSVYLITAPQEMPFYDLLRREHDNLRVLSAAPELKKGDYALVTPSADANQLPDNYALHRIDASIHTQTDPLLLIYRAEDQ